MSSLINPENNAIHLIDLLRITNQTMLTEEERQLLELLSSHIIIAWNTNSKLYLNNANTDRLQRPDNITLIDKSGLLHQTTDEFNNKLRIEWPGPQLPSHICD